MFINNLNPTLLELGPLTIRWYGLTMAIGVLAAVLMIIYLFKKQGLKEDLAISLIFWLFAGGLIGARLGYIIFYNLQFYLQNPGEIIFINHGGLSSHGLTLGLLASFFLFAKFKKANWKKIADIIVLSLPLLITGVRIGNFFNSEIVGRATNLAWGVKYISYEANPIPRHPVQIYEALAALAIFLLLVFVYRRKPQSELCLFNLFIFLYFTSRFLLEFTKEYQVMLPGSLFTQGQILSLPFIVFAVIFFFFTVNKAAKQSR